MEIVDQLSPYSISRRIEVTANALSQINGMRFDGFWSRLDELEPEDREHAIAEARFALENADAVLFSDEAVARAAKSVAEDFPWYNNYRPEVVQDHVRAVIAALKGANE